MPAAPATPTLSICYGREPTSHTVHKPCPRTNVALLVAGLPSALTALAAVAGSQTAAMLLNGATSFIVVAVALGVVHEMLTAPRGVATLPSACVMLMLGASPRRNMLRVC